MGERSNAAITISAAVMPSANQASAVVGIVLAAVSAVLEKVVFLEGAIRHGAAPERVE